MDYKKINENSACRRLICLKIKFFNENLHGKRRGWGSVRVAVTIGNTHWQTSIFPSSQLNAYLLPIKSEVRKSEKIAVGDTVKLALKINV